MVRAPVPHFNVIHDLNRELLRIEVDNSLPSLRVIRALDELVELRAHHGACGCTTARSSSAPR